MIETTVHYYKCAPLHNYTMIVTWPLHHYTLCRKWTRLRPRCRRIGRCTFRQPLWESWRRGKPSNTTSLSRRYIYSMQKMLQTCCLMYMYTIGLSFSLHFAPSPPAPLPSLPPDHSASSLQVHTQHTDDQTLHWDSDRAAVSWEAGGLQRYIPLCGIVIFSIFV